MARHQLKYYLNCFVMSDVLLSAAEWYELKGICGTVYKRIKVEQPIEDWLHFAVLRYLGLPKDSTCDYVPFGSIQFKMITTSITMLYNDSEEI